MDARWTLVWAGWGVFGCTGGPVPTSTGAGTPVALDPTCGDGGRVVLSLGVGDSADHAASVVRDADGTTRVFGTVDEPLPAPSVQTAWFSSVRLDAACAPDPSYGSGGLGWFTASEPDDQPEWIYTVRPDDDGGATVFGTATHPWDADGAASDQWAPTVARFAADGRQDTGFGAPFAFVADPGAPYPDGYDVRGIVSDVDGTARVLAQTAGHTALLSVDGDGFVPDATQIVSADRTIDGLTYEIEQVEGLQLPSDGGTLIGGTFVEPDGHDAQVPGVLRLGPDGEVDRSFGVDGVAGIGTAGPPEGRTAVALRPSGEVLLAGVFDLDPDGGYQALGVVRFGPDGAVDRSFGTAGVALVDLGQDDGWVTHAHALAAFAVADDGSMVLGGDVFALDAPDGDPAADGHIGLARLRADGTPDPGFADGGVFDAGPRSAGAPEQLAGLHVASDGTVTAAATRTNSDRDSDWVVYRLVPTAPAAP